MSKEFQSGLGVPKPVVVVAHNTAGTTITTTDAAVPFATEVIDTHNAWSTDTFTAPFTGWYRITANLQSGAIIYTASQGIGIGFRKNSSTESLIIIWGNGSATTQGGNASKVYALNAGDTLQVRSSASTNTDLNLNAGRCFVSIESIGFF